MYRFKLTFYSLSILTVCVLNGAFSQNIDQNETSTKNPVTPSASTISSTVQPPKNISCEVHNNNCKDCVANSQCYYCDENNQCHFHIQNVIADGQCKMKNAHFLTCRVNFKILIIIICSLIGVALLIILIVCCYCCCKKKGVKISKDDLKWARQKEERKQIASERRKERAERTEEIRKKYGLIKDSNPYQKFDA